MSSAFVSLKNQALIKQKISEFVMEIKRNEGLQDNQIQEMEDNPISKQDIAFMEDHCVSKIDVKLEQEPNQGQEEEPNQR